MDENIKKILVVDDESLIALEISRTLEIYGYKVITANTAKEAFRLIREDKDIGLVCMDIDLGNGMDGTAAAEIIMRDNTLPVIFLTSHTEKEIIEKAEDITSYGYVVKNTGNAVLAASIKMALHLHSVNTALKKMNDDIIRKNREMQTTLEKLEAANEELMRTQRDLIESETLQRTIIDNAPFGAHFYRLEGDCLVFTGANSAADSILGIKHGDLVNKTIGEAFPGLVDTPIPSIYKEIASKGATYEQDHVIYNEGIISGAYDIKAFRTMPGHMGVFFVDITEKKKSNEELTRSEEKYRFLSENIMDIISTMDLDKNRNYISQSVEKILGYTPEEKLKMPLAETLTPSSYKLAMETFASEYEKDVSGTGDPDRVVTLELESYHKNGSIVWLENRIKSIRDADGKVTGIYIISRDITELKKAKESLASSLEEKATLLQELQHRVKNSMATIISLISLETDLASEDQTKEALEKIKGRVLTLSKLYEFLYSNGKSNLIRLDLYLKRISSSVMEICSQNQYRIDIRESFSEINVDSRKASAFGLILNELLTNTYKHAYPDRGGIVNISLSPEDGKIVLTVEDEGRGLHEGFIAEKTRGLGLVLVRTLAKQLGGGLECRGGSTTRFTVWAKDIIR